MSRTALFRLYFILYFVCILEVFSCGMSSSFNEYEHVNEWQNCTIFARRRFTTVQVTAFVISTAQYSTTIGLVGTKNLCRLWNGPQNCGYKDLQSGSAYFPINPCRNVVGAVNSLTGLLHWRWQNSAPRSAAALEFKTEWVSSSLTAHQHIIGYSVPYLRLTSHLPFTCPCGPVCKTLGRHVQ